MMDGKKVKRKGGGSHFITPLPRLWWGEWLVSVLEGACFKRPHLTCLVLLHVLGHYIKSYAD
jgi:hypothetical protein